MRNVHKTWTKRWIATAAALALIFACIVGAYGHGVGHAHHQTPHGAYAVSGEVADVAFVAKPMHVDAEHEGADVGNAHAGCYDFICHGGHAILAGHMTMLHPLPGAVVILPAETLSSTQSGRLERPPRSPVLA